MPAVAQHLRAIHEHVHHSGRELVRLVEGCVVLDAHRIKDDDVRVVARP
jgi:hypothetical protein